MPIGPTTQFSAVAFARVVVGSRTRKSVRIRISEYNLSPGAHPKPREDFLRQWFAKPLACFSRSIAAGHEPTPTERTSAAPSAVPKDAPLCLIAIRAETISSLH